MPREFGRNIRIAEAIRRITAPHLTSLARDYALGMISITNVAVAGDLSTAKIAVSVLGNSAESEVLRKLRAHLPQLRTVVARELRLKKIPMLYLEEDRTMARGARIAELLNPPKNRAP